MEVYLDNTDLPLPREVEDPTPHAVARARNERMVTDRHHDGGRDGGKSQKGAKGAKGVSLHQDELFSMAGEDFAVSVPTAKAVFYEVRQVRDEDARQEAERQRLEALRARRERRRREH